MEFSPAQVLAKYIMAQDIPLFTLPTERLTWPLFFSRMPDETTEERNCAAIYDTTPVRDGRLQNGGENIFHWGVSIKVRAKSYYDGWKQIQDLIALLQTVHNEEITIETKTYTLYNVSLASGPLPMGRIEGGQDKGREFFSVNFTVSMKEA